MSQEFIRNIITLVFLAWLPVMAVGQTNIDITSSNGYVESYNLKGDMRKVDSLTITAGGTTLSATAGTFQSVDIGKTVVIYGAGKGTDGKLGDELISTISSFITSSQVTLSDTAAVTVSTRKGIIGTDNTAAFQSMLATGQKEINFSSTGNYFFGTTAISISNDTNIIINGNGARVYFISSNPNSFLIGSQPQRHWINQDSSVITIIKIEFFNIGQTEARQDTLNEGNYYSYLNSVSTIYNRRYNKTANTGAVVYNTNGSTTIQDCVFHEVGSIHNFSGASSDVRNIFENNKVIGWGQVALFPGPNSSVSNNYFDNSNAPILSSTDINSDIGTSHGIYVSGGYDNVNISGNTFRGIRYYAVQYQTSGGNPSRNNTISNNNFIECWSWLTFSGNNSEFYADVNGGTVSRCGSASLALNSARVLFEGIHFDSTYTNRSGAFNLSLGSEISIRDCHFQNINNNSNDVAIVIGAAYTGIVSIANNFFDSTIYWACEILGDGSAHDRISFMSNESYAPIRIGNSVSGATAGSGKAISITKNLFHGYSLFTKVGVIVQDNVFDVKNSIYAITANLDATSDSLMISNNTFKNTRSSGNAFILNISGSANTGRTIFTGNTVYGAYDINLGAFSLSSLSMFNFYYNDRILKGGGPSKLWIGTDFSSGSTNSPIVVSGGIECRKSNTSVTSYGYVGFNSGTEFGIWAANSISSGAYLSGGPNSNLSNASYVRAKGLAAGFGIELHGGGYNSGGDISFNVWRGNPASTGEIIPLTIKHTTGNVGLLGITSPTARLQLPAGTSTASTAPLKFTSGTSLATPEAGAIEWDGDNLFITQTTGPTRKTIAYTSDIPADTVYIKFSLLKFTDSLKTVSTLDNNYWVTPSELNGYKIAKILYGVYAAGSGTGSVTVGLTRLTSTRALGYNNGNAVSFTSGDINLTSTGSTTIVTGDLYHFKITTDTAVTHPLGLTVTMMLTN